MWVALIVTAFLFNDGTPGASTETEILDSFNSQGSCERAIKGFANEYPEWNYWDMDYPLPDMIVTFDEANDLTTYIKCVKVR